MARVLGRVRLSRSTDESTSIERQREAIEQWSKMHGHEIVAWAVDVDVSGSVSPFEAPELGPYLSTRLGDWDILCTYRLDRVARRVIPLHGLFELCKTQEKTLVSVTENIDLSHWVGRLVATVIAGVAEGELEATTERVKGSRETLRKEGRWAGGAPVFGMMAVRRDDGPGYEVVRDPGAFEHLRFLVDRALAGDSLNSIANTLNSQGVPTPQDYRRKQKGREIKGTKWRTNTITSILTSPTLLGNMSHGGGTVAGLDGLPVKSGADAVTLAEWKQLQARLVQGVTPRTRTENTSLLLDVATCFRCGAKMYRQRAVKRGKEYKYYRCANVTGATKTCDGKSVQADELETAITNTLLREVGDVEITRRVLVPGSDYTAQLEEAQLALVLLTEQAGMAKSAFAQKMYRDQLEALDTRIASLESLPQVPDEWKHVGTGVTYREAWKTNTTEERRRLLIDSEISFKVDQAEQLFVASHLTGEFLERAFPGYEYPTLPAMTVDEVNAVVLGEAAPKS